MTKFISLHKLPNFHRKTLLALVGTYVFFVASTTLAIFFAYLLIFPDARDEVMNLLKGTASASFNLNGYKESLPNTIKNKSDSSLLFVLFAHAFSVMVLNMLFQAVITAKLIKPKIDFRVSDGATYDPSYGRGKTPHVLFRLINACDFELHLVSLKVFLIVHDEESGDESSGATSYYFPVPDVDPKDIPVLYPMIPWIIAIPVGGTVGNSVINEYAWQLTRPTGSKPGRRQLQVLVTGYEKEASTAFMEAVTLNLESVGPHALICGVFQTLPQVLNPKSLDDINRRILTKPEKCCSCPDNECKFRVVQNPGSQ